MKDDVSFRKGVQARRPPITSATILDLARRVERLIPSPRRPDRFHEDKSEIIASLYRLADEVRRG